MNKRTLLLILCCISATLLRAQDAGVGPLVKPPSPGSTWVVKIVNPAIPTKKAGDPVQGKPEERLSLPTLLSMKYGQNRVTQGQITNNDGQQDTFYVVNGSLLVQAKATKRVYAISLQSNERDPYSLQVSAFPGLAWVSKAAYKGTEKKNGVDCSHYAKTENFGGTDLKMEAWIAEDSRYPVEAKVGDLTYRFEAVQPFPEDVPLPEDFRKALAQVNGEQSALDAMRKSQRR